MDLEKAKRTLKNNGHQSLKMIDPSNQYIRAYPFILDAVQCLSENLEENSFMAISQLVYGWMPTILKNYDFSFHTKGNFDKILRVSTFDQARGFVAHLPASPVNGSWVGLSKALHFLRPEVFPIWDSKVARQFGLNNAYHMGKSENYIKYIGFCETHADEQVVADVQQRFKNEAGYEITSVRACEFILFSLGASGDLLA